MSGDALTIHTLATRHLGFEFLGRRLHDRHPVSDEGVDELTAADTCDLRSLGLGDRLGLIPLHVLKSNGSFFVHLDYREVHYIKVLLDTIFGRDSFQNEIIWAYDYGARSRTKWPAKHDNILWYAKNPNDYQFHLEECDRIPSMAPGLAGAEKAATGKIPTDTWWHTMVSPNEHEKAGYPTQKPRGILDRIVKVHSHPRDLLLDFFAGSGTFGESAIALGRRCILVGNNPEALRVMERRFADYDVDWHDRAPKTDRDGPLRRTLVNILNPGAVRGDATT